MWHIKPAMRVTYIQSNDEGEKITLANAYFNRTIHIRCQPWRAKRRLVIPGSREAALLTRRARSAPEGKQSRHPNTASSHPML
ncbi:MAG: hypothetical protein RPU59_04130, partial [Candidatus Sedimenticola sp. (ex Thyasira tokunagai)]